MKLLPQPTVEGMARGIIGVDPIVLQCGECGDTLTQDRDGIAAFIILARWNFCGMENDRQQRTQGPRRCRDCMAAHARDCARCAEWIR
jgi:hypothetical protein